MSKNFPTELVRRAYAGERMDRQTAQRTAEALGILSDLPAPDGHDDAGQPFWLTSRFKDWAGTATRARNLPPTHCRGLTPEQVDNMERRKQYLQGEVYHLQSEQQRLSSEDAGIPDRIKFFERGGTADFEGLQSAEKLRERSVEIAEKQEGIANTIATKQKELDEIATRLKGGAYANLQS